MNNLLKRNWLSNDGFTEKQCKAIVSLGCNNDNYLDEMYDLLCTIQKDVEYNRELQKAIDILTKSNIGCEVIANTVLKKEMNNVSDKIQRNSERLVWLKNQFDYNLNTLNVVGVIPDDELKKVLDSDFEKAIVYCTLFKQAIE